MQTITEIRDPQGGRNFIRQGDPVKVDPTVGRSFHATFRSAKVDDEGNLIEVEVYGSVGKTTPGIRTVRPECVRRVATTNTKVTGKLAQKAVASVPPVARRGRR